MCSKCGDHVGVYELTVVVGPRGRRATSQAREPGLAPVEESVFHARCAPPEIADDPRE